MHRNFGEWYRLVSIEPNGEILTKRWAGVEEWASTLQGAEDATLETVRIFQGLAPKRSREPFLAAFRAHDPAFPQRNELELRVLAGASLLRCVQRGVDDNGGMRAAIIAGTAVGASSLRMPDRSLSEVTGEILAALQEIATSRRRRGKLDTDAIRSAIDVAAQAMAAVEQAANWQILRDQMVPAFQAVLDALRHSESALTTAEHSLWCADEETDILWWLEGGSSRDLDRPWSAVPADAVPLIAASELGDLTEVVLGPQDVAAILARVVTSANCKETSIQAYVNAVPDDWLQARELQPVEGALDLAPLSLALFHRASSDSSRWQQFFEGASGVKPSVLLAPELVARQAYTEAVLLRTLVDGDG